MIKDDNYLKIINHYGINNQQRKLAEEVFELQEAIISANNFKENVGVNIFTGKVPEEFYNHIAEELADVIVILEQFKRYYNIPDDEIEKIKDFKVKRQLERIDNNEKI